jgi:formate hydrogenlyase subunit 6/NADH:ubiquinone oxidoreductase subunit I
LKIPIIKAVAQWISEFIDSFQSIRRSAVWLIPYLFGVGDLRKEVTEQYPDPVSSKTEDDFPPRSRGFIKNDIEQCTGCGDCLKACPTNCIVLKIEPGFELRKTWVSTFDVDFSQCVFCGLCVEVCLPRSLTHSKVHVGPKESLQSLVQSFGKGPMSEGERIKLIETNGSIEGEAFNAN